MLSLTDVDELPSEESGIRPGAGSDHCQTGAQSCQENVRPRVAGLRNGLANFEDSEQGPGKPERSGGNGECICAEAACAVPDESVSHSRGTSDQPHETKTRSRPPPGKGCQETSQNRS